MADDFYSAYVPEPTTVLGLQLRPLSLGHLILLNRFDSVFITGNGSVSFTDLALSALVCSLNYEDGRSLAYDNSDADKAMVQWHNRLTGGDMFAVRLGIRKQRILDLESEAKRFSDYIAQHSKVPYYAFNPSDFKEMHCPSVQVVKVRLMRDMKFTEAELLDRSWQLCLWDYVTLKAMAGELTMCDEQRIRDAEMAAKEMADAIQRGEFNSN